jgi:hypothetical protein
VGDEKITVDATVKEGEEKSEEKTKRRSETLQSDKWKIQDFISIHIIPEVNRTRARNRIQIA